MQKFTMELVMELDNLLEHEGIFLASEDDNGAQLSLSATDVLKVSEIISSLLLKEAKNNGN